MRTIKAAIAGILTLFAATVAVAQTFPTVPGKSVIGRMGVAGDTGPSQAIPFATLQAQLGVPTLPAIYAATYGVRCNGTADDAPALKRAVAVADSLGGVPVILPAGTCNLSSQVFLNKWSVPGLLTVPGIQLVGQGRDTTTLDTRVANNYAISINPDWKAAHQALAGITASASGGSLATNTYYVQISMNDNVGNEIYVTIPKSVAVTGPTGSISIALPVVNTGYSYNIHMSTASTPANYALFNGATASGIAGNQNGALTAVGGARTVPTDKRAVWQQVNISDLSITNSTGVANASGISFFKVGYSSLNNVYLNGMTANGFDVPNYSGDIDGSFVITIDKSKFDTIAGWCVNAAGNVLELSNFTVSNSVFNLCGTSPTGLNVNRTITSITNAVTNLVTTSVAHGWSTNDQIYISGVTGMTLPAGWYRVGALTGTTQFNLKTLDGVIIDTTALGAYSASSGTGSLSWRPPTATTGSGALMWTGLIGTFKNNGFTQNKNVSIYISEIGTSDSAILENNDYENTYGKGLYIGALKGGVSTNGECLSQIAFGTTISCVQIGTGFNAGGVENFQILNMKVRSDVTPAVGFEQFNNTNTTSPYVDTTSVSGTTWQLFNSANTRFSGFKFRGINGLARFSITGVNTATLIPVGYGATLPMKMAGAGEWVEYHVPVAGIVRGSIGGLTPATKYYFYLYNSATLGLPTVGAIEVSATAPTLDSEGYSVKTGDSTRALIGEWTTDGAGNFQTAGVGASWYPPNPALSSANSWTGLQTFNAMALVNTQNANTSFGITNASTGTSAAGSTTLTNSNDVAAFGLGGSGYTGVAGLQNRAYVYAGPALDGINIYTAGTDPIVFTVAGAQVGSFAGATGRFTTTNAILTTPDLGTPSAATLTSATGLPISTGVSGLGAGVATFLATPSSANLATAVTGETGSGALVFGTNPTFSADINVTANVLATGALSVFGSGTTGTNNARVSINGGSGSNAGASVLFSRNSVALFSFGNSAGILGGASDDFVIYSNVSGAGTNAAINISSANSNVTINSGIATPAGGSTAARLLFGTTAGFGIYYGSGAPTVSAAQGSIYIRSNGTTTNDRMYINTNGSTTWTAVTTAS